MGDVRGGLLGFVMLLALSACRRDGEPLGQVVFDGPGTRSTQLDVPPEQELFFRIEGAGIGGAGATNKHRGRYVLDVTVTGDSSASTQTCDPLYLANSGMGSHDGANHTFRGDIQACVMRPAPVGRAELVATLRVPGITDIGITRATVTAYAAPVRGPDAGAAAWWEGGEMTGTERVVSFVIFAAFLCLLGGWFLVRQARRRADKASIWETGVPATAEVLAVTESGGSMNDHPGVELRLAVNPEGSPAFEATVTFFARLIAIPRIQPGCTVTVRLDPNDTTRVVIDPDLEAPAV